MLRELSAGVVGGATNVKVRGTNDIFEGTEGKKISEPPHVGNWGVQLFSTWVSRVTVIPSK